MTETSVFSRIMAGELPANKFFEDDRCVVIEDWAPQAPTHLLIIPRKALTDLTEAGVEDKLLLGHLLWVASEVARRLRLEEGFRLIINNGRDAGQSVFHLHIHLLAQRKLCEANLAEI
ncbi:MAG: histidine triad nucleotide-binding protein [Gammaproteobacteria bacterium]|nr:histidine triad nucleotide-binding protein [Gammaproteobacteria bacterium]